MKPYRWLILGLLGCLAVAALAYFWTMGMMDSLFAYRSPLKDNPPAAGQPLGEPLTRRVVIVLIDALRQDTALKVDVMPFLGELRQQGAAAAMHSRPPSFSAPAWTTLLTGAWPDINDGQPLNPPTDARAFTQDDIFAAADRAGLRTAVSGYGWFEGMLANSGMDAGFYTPGEDHAADIQVVDAALPWLKSGDYQFILIHLDQVDYAGHYEGGPRDPRWDAAARRADALLGEIVSHLDLEQDTVIVLSDHGQIERGGHGGQDAIVLLEPFVIAGKGVRPGAYADIGQIDVAPTIAALLGTHIPATAQGTVLREILVLSSAQETQISAALVAQKNQLVDAYQAAIGTVADQQLPANALPSNLIDQARAKRLGLERIGRALLALFILVIPAAALYLKRSKTVLWLLIGAILYILVFNLRYAILDGRTYSLSSVVSQNDLLIFNAVTAAIAIGVAWLATMLILGAFRLRPRRAAQLSLAQTFMVLFLLAIPILWSYVLNGAIITWTLPDFASMFMGFISLVQSLMVAALGLVLAGMTALIAWVVARFRT